MTLLFRPHSQSFLASHRPHSAGTRILSLSLLLLPPPLWTHLICLDDGRMTSHPCPKVIGGRRWVRQVLFVNSCTAMVVQLVGCLPSV